MKLSDSSHSLFSSLFPLKTNPFSKRFLWFPLIWAVNLLKLFLWTISDAAYLMINHAAPSETVVLLLVRYFTWVYFHSLSQTSVDPGREGHSPGHRGETVLGVPGQWEAETLLHVAEERPTASLGGKLQPVSCHLPVFHFKDLIFSLGSCFHFREPGVKHIAVFPSAI